MGKKIYEINGKMYVIDGETGEVGIATVLDNPVSQEDLNALIKILAKNQKDD
jgi:hypothetical protein